MDSRAERVLCVALLRGINVGKAKRISMADLREIFEQLGHRDVRTLLASGNVLFRTAQSNRGKLSAGIEAAIAQRFGFRAPVVVLTADELAAIVADPPANAGRDPARLLVAFVGAAPALRRARALLRQAWGPETLAVGPRAAYLWCADGIVASKLLQAFTRATGDAATTRNWTTVLKLAAAIGDQGHNPGWARTRGKGET